MTEKDEIIEIANIWGMTDEDWEKIIRHLGAAYRPRIEYSADPGRMTDAAIRQARQNIGAVLAIMKRQAPAHIKEMIDFAQTGDFRP